MDLNHIFNFVEKSRKKGFSDKKIKDFLISKGYDPLFIDQALRNYGQYNSFKIKTNFFEFVVILLLFFVILYFANNIRVFYFSAIYGKEVINLENKIVAISPVAREYTVLLEPLIFKISKSNPLFSFFKLKQTTLYSLTLSKISNNYVIFKVVKLGRLGSIINYNSSKSNAYSNILNRSYSLKGILKLLYLNKETTIYLENTTIHFRLQSISQNSAEFLIHS